MIIGLLNQKGGVGKTTLATHIAGELASEGARVAVIDADPQGSALDWAQTRAQSGLPRLFGVIGLAREVLHQEVPDLAKANDHIVIDGPPRVTALARSTILASDLILIPVQPSSYDLWASMEIVGLVNEARMFKPDLKAAFVVNRCITGTVVGRDMRSALDGEIPALNTVIGQRIAFVESVATGRLVRELDGRGQAAKEITALTAELKEQGL
ncbi:Cobyrinic acid ac-diamide synthase [Ancylobacter novellus DSM 506]|uniref:Cobyrinic acid ac-diamide synthase n=1 Tax=Ancylobacter novellus (strain ATCC 8093 / DSM 506 / JCM 20403 / CCM 1077 / IAM 12100 / NBRC 12443 / NCIMB 10456) TaxID=639283 RepID=D7A1E3_ANCN5|nr:ParA family partition ATPase [Ancylobacter novellus]ADH89501.1 Cobyrinic acid ac-diamide synthase [Ancylobacter novellus DSM 506]